MLRAWYLSSGSVVVNSGPCVVQERFLCDFGCGSCVLFDQRLYSRLLWSVRGTRAVSDLL
jgi:hypothetical protein